MDAQNDFIGQLRALVLAIGPAATARRLAVNERTVRRWLSGQTRPYAFICRLIDLETRAAFGTLPAPWHAWRLAADGMLYAEDLKHGFVPADLYQLHILRQQVRESQALTRKQAALIESLQEQPAPGTRAPVTIRL